MIIWFHKLSTPQTLRFFSKMFSKNNLPISKVALHTFRPSGLFFTRITKNYRAPQ